VRGEVVEAVNDYAIICARSDAIPPNLKPIKPYLIVHNHYIYIYILSKKKTKSFGCFFMEEIFNMSRISVRRAQGESPSKTAVASIDDARDWTPIHMDKYNRENKNSNIIIIHKEISEAREQGRSRRRRDRRGRGSLRGRGWSSTAAPATARTPLPLLLPFIIYRI